MIHFSNESELHKFANFLDTFEQKKKIFQALLLHHIYVCYLNAPLDTD